MWKGKIWYLHNLRRQVARLLAALLPETEKSVQNQVALLALGRVSKPTVFHGQYEPRHIEIAFAHSDDVSLWRG